MNSLTALREDKAMGRISPVPEHGLYPMTVKSLPPPPEIHVSATERRLKVRKSTKKYQINRFPAAAGYFIYSTDSVTLSQARMVIRSRVRKKALRKTIGVMNGGSLKGDSLQPPQNLLLKVHHLLEPPHFPCPAARWWGRIQCGY